MTGPGFLCGSPYGSFMRVDENTMDDLKQFLQDMTKTIEFLYARHNAARQAAKINVFEKPDLRTSLSIGIPSTSLKMLPTREEISRTDLRGDLNGFKIPSHPFQPAFTSEQLLFGQRYDEGKMDSMQSWFVQSSILDDRVRGGKTKNVEASPWIAAICGTEAPNHASNVGTNSQDHSSDAENADDLRAFLEDMKLTIQAWCGTHDLLKQRRADTAKRDADTQGAELRETPEAVCPRSHPLDAHFRVTDRNLGVDRTSCSTCKDKGAAVIQVLDLPNQRADEASRSRNDKEDLETEHFIQFRDEKARDKSSPPAEHEKADTTSFLLQKQIAGQQPTHDNAPRQEKADAQEPSKAAGMCCYSASPINVEEDPVQHNSSVVHKEVDVGITLRNDIGEVDNFVTPKVDRAEAKTPRINWIVEAKTEAISDDSARGMKIQPYRRKVDVVDSPEWLPKGWITEVKTRISGNSAGSKDKYYFDPVSKRRFRSKKEVFCFLETGKLGRYKSKPKVTPVKALETELPSPGQVIDSTEARPSKRVRKTSSKSQQTTSGVAGPSNVPAIGQPPGLFSNLFWPYRPGQPSDWLMYENLASLPVPLFEHFRYAEYNRSKCNDGRGPPVCPWFLNSPEGFWRPVFDKNYLGKCTEKSKDVQGMQSSAGAEVFETLPKNSTAEAKKTTTRSST